MSTEGQKLTSASNVPLLEVNLKEARQLCRILLSGGMIKSISEGMRLIKAGAIDVTAGDEKNSTIFKIGKRRYLKVYWGESCQQ